MIRLLSIVGARPQFVKLSALQDAIDEHVESHEIQHEILHTGQHYDAKLADVFFKELDIPHASFNLGVGSGPHGEQTGKMLMGIEKVMLDRRPDMVLIFGDTNSTVAGALAATKLHIPVAHIEAGLRSYKRTMPEEINRIASDHISDLLLAPTLTALENLKREALEDKTFLTGDIMYDVLRKYLPLALQRSDLLHHLKIHPHQYYLVTLHRAENTDDPVRLRSTLDLFSQISTEQRPLVFPMHPRTKHAIQRTVPDWKPGPYLNVIDPVGYLDMLNLSKNARITLTDSGGLQKEVFFLGCPAITLRDETEWVETVQAGGNILTGCDPMKVRNAIAFWEEKIMSDTVDFSEEVHKHFGQGDASLKILDAVLEYLQAQSAMSISSSKFC